MYQGKLSQQIIIHYKNPTEPNSIVKIHLRNDHLEFEMFFARLKLEGTTLYGQDVTINWESLDLNVEKPGLFFTDANAYKIVKRDVGSP